MTQEAGGPWVVHPDRFAHGNTGLGSLAKDLYSSTLWRNQLVVAYALFTYKGYPVTRIDFGGRTIRNRIWGIYETVFERLLVAPAPSHVLASVDDEVMRFDGSTWESLGQADGLVRVLHSVGDDIVVGGAFTRIGGVAANRIARWHAGTWTALGAGLDGTVAAIDGQGDDLVVGGAFSLAGGLPAQRIARWRAGAWSALGEGVPVPEVRNVTVNGDQVFTCTNAGYLTWNGAAWSGDYGLGAGLGQHDIWAKMAAIEWRGALAVAGTFSTAGSVTASNIAIFDGRNWQPLAEGLPDTVRALAVRGTSLVAGGRFAGGIASWDGAAWSRPYGNLEKPVAALDASDDTVVAYLDDARIVRWTSAAGWTVISGPSAYENTTLMIDGDGVIANNQWRTLRWNGVTWSSIEPAGFRGRMVLSRHGGRIYGWGGDRLYRWDGTAWQTVRNLTTPMPESATSVLVTDSGLLYSRGFGDYEGSIEWVGLPYGSMHFKGFNFVTALAQVGDMAYAVGGSLGIIGFHLHTNLAPTYRDRDSQVDAVNRSAPAGHPVGIQAAGSDPEGSDCMYRLIGTDAAYLQIDAQGVVRTAGDLSGIAGGSASCAVVISDGWMETTIPISIAFVAAGGPPTAPVDADGTANNLPENAPAGTTVGVVPNAIDPEGGAVAFALTAGDDRFAIDAATGIITSRIPFDFETTGSATCAVVASDGSTTSAATVVTIAITDVDEEPTIVGDPDPTANSVREDATPGTYAGVRVDARDPDNRPLTWRVVGGGPFQADSTGRILVAGPLNYEATSTYEVDVEVSDGRWWLTKTFTIAVTDVDDPPSVPVDLDTAANRFSSATALGSAVGITARATDPEGTAITYASLDDQFAIDPVTGIVTLARQAADNADRSLSVTVRATAGAKSATASFVVEQVRNDSSTSTSTSTSSRCGLGGGLGLIAGAWVGLLLRRRVRTR